MNFVKALTLEVPQKQSISYKYNIIILLNHSLYKPSFNAILFLLFNLNSILYFKSENLKFIKEFKLF
jgi:hypothetical protein